MKPSLLSALLMQTLCFAVFPLLATATAAEPNLRADLEALVQQSYPNDAPGAAVIVVQDGNTVYRGAHGVANLELAVPLRAEHVFRVGSITKQFTAAAILLLADEGRLDVADPISKYLPAWQAQGHRVTIQHLLSHTSGIANYTELPDWRALMRSDVSVDQLIQTFQNKPFDFAPGERWKYDNSGYVLLGAIIEKVSGQTYADFLRTRIFAPLNMTNSGYENQARITPGRVAGYMRDGAQWRNADFVSMTHPYAAGALVSTVDDLARWNAAIENGALLKPSSWQRASTSFALPDGTLTRYGAGWIIGRVGPAATLEHGGGINGFNAYVLRAPAAHLYIAVLANASPPGTPPQELAVKLAARVLQVSVDAPRIAIPEKRLDEYAGRYLLDGGQVLTVSREQNRLYATRTDAERLELVPIGKDLFEERAHQARFRFRREGGRIAALETEPRILMGERARRPDAAR